MAQNFSGGEFAYAANVSRIPLGKFGQELIREHIELSQERAKEAAGRRRHPVWSTVKYLTGAAIEAVPGPIFGDFGIGDVVSAGEILVGRTVDGTKLSKIERFGVMPLAILLPIPTRLTLSAFRRWNDDFFSKEQEEGNVPIVRPAFFDERGVFEPQVTSVRRDLGFVPMSQPVFV
jgi:hypothetical protein